MTHGFVRRRDLFRAELECQTLDVPILIPRLDVPVLPHAQSFSSDAWLGQGYRICLLLGKLPLQTHRFCSAHPGSDRIGRLTKALCRPHHRDQSTCGATANAPASTQRAELRSPVASEGPGGGHPVSLSEGPA